MEYLKEILKRQKKVNLPERMDLLILDRKELIIKKVLGQWKKGLRPDGSIIGTYRSFAYQREKFAQNPEAGGNVDLILTGALSKGLTINKVLESTFTIFSTDSKAVGIAEKYGLDVYGINDKDAEDFLDMIAGETLITVMNEVYA